MKGKRDGKGTGVGARTTAHYFEGLVFGPFRGCKINKGNANGSERKYEIKITERLLFDRSSPSSRGGEREKERDERIRARIKQHLVRASYRISRD